MRGQRVTAALLSLCLVGVQVRIAWAKGEQEETGEETPASRPAARPAPASAPAKEEPPASAPASAPATPASVPATAPAAPEWGGPERKRPKGRPSLAPVVFSQEEINTFEEAHTKRRNRLVLIVGGSTLGTLLASGITLLAVGLGTKPGSVAMSSTGVSCLGLATIAVFTGLELYTW